MLNVDVESIALEESLKIGIMLEDWVVCRLADLSFEGHATRFDKVCVETANGLLLWRRGNDYSRVVGVQLLV